jgi:hypothetical protein
MKSTWPVDIPGFLTIATVELIHSYGTYFFYERESWSFVLYEERRLIVSENRVLRKIFVPQREEVRGKWGKLFKERIHDL